MTNRLSLLFFVSLCASITLSGSPRGAHPSRAILQASSASPFSIEASGDRVTIADDHGRASLRLDSIVAPTGAEVVLGDAVARATADSLSLERGAVDEHYVRGNRLVEQLFAIPSAPSATRGTVSLRVEPIGLTARAVSADEVALVDANGARRFGYGVVRVRDHLGRTLPSTLSVEGGRIAIGYDDRDATYPVLVDPSMWSFSAEFGPGGGGAANAGFGSSVAVDGDALVVGAPTYVGSTGGPQGAAYVFRRTAAAWQQIGAALLPSTARMNAEFGKSVDIDVVGARVRVVVGAPGDSNGTTTTGQAYVFEDAGTGVYTQIATLTPSFPSVTTGDHFGASVSIDDAIVVVGAPDYGMSLSSSGGVEIFVKPGVGMFASRTTIARTGAMANEQFGASVAIAGTTIAVGAPKATTVGTNAFGAVEIFTTSDSMTWTGGTTLPSAISSPTAAAHFGAAVAFDGSALFVGAPDLQRGSMAVAGGAYVFDAPSYAGTAEVFPPTAEMLARFGTSVAFDANTYVVGSSGSTGTTSEAGAAFVFTRSGSSLGTGVSLQAATQAFGDHVGTAVAVAHLAASQEVLVSAPTRTGASSMSGTVLVGSFGASIGDACTVDTDCAAGHCVDGVCCNSTCGGNNTSDCLACSTGAGALVNGMCATRTIGACMGSGDGGAGGTPFADPRVASCSTSPRSSSGLGTVAFGAAVAFLLSARRRRTTLESARIKRGTHDAARN